MPDIRELGQKVKARYPKVYDDLDDAELGRKVKARYPGAYDDFADTPAQPQESTYEWLKRNVGLGIDSGLQGLTDKLSAAGNIVGSATIGDFGPAIEAAKIAGRGAVSLAGRLTAFAPADPEVGRLQQQQAQRLEAADPASWSGSQLERERIAAEEAKDPALSSRVVRGAVSGGIQAAPIIAAGAASGGSIPAMAVAGGALSLDEPQNLAANVALSSVPLPVGQAARAGYGAVRRLLGRGAEQIVEAEARAAAPAAGRVVTGAVDDMAAIRAQSGLPPIESAPSISSATLGVRGAPSGSIRAAGPALETPSLEAAIQQGAAELPGPLAQRIKAEVAAVYHLPRAVMASGDISAPFRQGALLTLPPSQWGKAARAGVRMFQAFKTKNYERIVEQIGQHPDAPVAQNAGLHLSTQAREGLQKTEEAFISKYAEKIPIVKQSEQAYKTYLDSLRIDTFSKYRKLIDAADLAPARREAAYKAAADWVNIATGRGSLGANFESAMPLLNTFLFAPRYAASRLNVLNPMMYARNAATQEGRIVLKQQMSELMQFAGVIATSLGIAKAAGADVNLSPSSSDFLKIRAGKFRYDPLAGLQQALRLIYRTGAAITNAARGEKVKPGESALDIGGHYLRSKLGPAPSYFTDFLLGREYTGQKFRPLAGAVERAVPLAWSDFISAWWNEGFGAAMKTTPGLVGIGVSEFDAPDSLLERAAPLMSEYVRAGRQIPEIRKAEDESDDDFNARVKVFGEAMERFGLGLVGSDEYKRASVEEKDAALDLLPKRISSALMRQGEAWQLQPRILVDDVKESREMKPEAGPHSLYDVNGRRIR